MLHENWSFSCSSKIGGLTSCTYYMSRKSITDIRRAGVGRWWGNAASSPLIAFHFAGSIANQSDDAQKRTKTGLFGVMDSCGIK